MSCLPTNKKLCCNEDCTVCFNKSCASHKIKEEWSPINEKSPRQTFLQSNKKVWLICKECGHLKNTSPNKYYNRDGCCSYCANQILCDSIECNACFNKSFASHSMTKCWSSKNNMNPRNIFKNSDKKIIFICSDCNHELIVKLDAIKNDKYCPYCSSNVLCNNDECLICFNKSCASHNKMKDEWDLANVKSPRETFLKSLTKIKLKCSECKHLHETRPADYARNNGCCSYCSNKLLCTEDECMECFNKSFASNPLSIHWSSKNGITPRNTFKGSNKKITFNCDKCNQEFQSVLYSISAGQWCPFCKNKTEAKLLLFLKEKYDDCKRQVRFEWCRFSKTNSIMPVDFVLPDNKIIIELDGKQHFNQVLNWESPEIIQERDIEKINNSINNGYSIIRIYQPDVWNDKYDWKKTLNKAINQIKESGTQIIFISSNNCYNIYETHLSSDIKINYIKY